MKCLNKKSKAWKLVLFSFFAFHFFIVRTIRKPSYKRPSKNGECSGHQSSAHRYALRCIVEFQSEIHKLKIAFIYEIINSVKWKTTQITDWTHLLVLNSHIRVIWHSAHVINATLINNVVCFDIDCESAADITTETKEISEGTWPQQTDRYTHSAVYFTCLCKWNDGGKFSFKYSTCLFFLIILLNFDFKLSRKNIARSLMYLNSHLFFHGWHLFIFPKS